ncbi:MAG: Gfo/Idh/MocA family protein [Terriglobales bacterium]
MNKIRVAAVGLGWVATHRHLPVMERSGDFEIVGVIDRAPGQARKLMSQRGYEHYAETANLAEIEWLNDVDAITVATAPMSHYSLIKQALQLGKHVLTDKPFTMSVPEGEELVTLAKAKDRRLAIVHNFQFARSTKKLIAEIEGGELGTIRSLNAVQFGNPGRRLPQWYEELPLGLMYDESPHLLYLLRRFAGEMEVSRCLTHPSSSGANTPARIDAYFRSSTFPGPITLSCNFESPVSEWYLMVFGEKSLGIVDVFRDIYISLPNDGTHDTRTVFRTSWKTITQHVWQHIVSGIPHLRGTLVYGNDEVFGRFARAIHGAVDELKPIGPESALAVLRLQHALVERQEVFHGVAAEMAMR